VWSPNGRWIAYQQLAYSAEGLVPSKLEIVSPSGSDSYTIWNPNVHEALSFSWSLDSTRIAFVTETGEIGTGTLNGKVTMFKLPGRLFVEGYPDNPPEWSPDGKTLVFAVGPSSRRNETSMYAIGADGRGLRRIG